MIHTYSLTGAMSISLLMLVDDIKDMFVSAIWQSQPLGIPFRNPQTWGEIPHLLIKFGDCSNRSDIDIIDCLYSLNQTQIISIQKQIEGTAFQLQKFMDVCFF